jgi:nucleoside-diphosphate-sugar epimerase
LAPDTGNLNSAPVLVTGGTGFLGRHIVERLLTEGRTVTVLARRPAPDLEERGVRFVAADLADAGAVSRACQGIGTVFHLAAKVGVWGRYGDFYRANVLGTRAVLAGCRAHGVRRFVYTSTPGVVYNGRDLAGADESLPLTTRCPAAYVLTKALAEREVLAANSPELLTVALRPHLIWGVGDPHLVPRILKRARAGRLRIVGSGRNRVDLLHVRNAADAHLLAERALGEPPSAAFGPRPSPPAQQPDTCNVLRYKPPGAGPAAGRAYFITNGEPVVLWDWINDLLRSLGLPPATRQLWPGAAFAVGAACELLWRLLPLGGEPPMTRFVAKELATDHWFDISAARRDLGYTPRVSMAEGIAELIASLRLKA